MTGVPHLHQGSAPFFIGVYGVFYCDRCLKADQETGSFPDDCDVKGCREPVPPLTEEDEAHAVLIANEMLSGSEVWECVCNTTGWRKGTRHRTAQCTHCERRPV